MFSVSHRGSAFSDITVQLVWNNATIIPGANPNLYRKDKCGALIQRDRYGMTIRRGWEIDHIIPREHGGTDLLSNLQALQWQNNRAKSDSYPAIPALFCVVRS